MSRPTIARLAAAVAVTSFLAGSASVLAFVGPAGAAPLPSITSLSRTSGPVTGGTQVTVNGTGFTTVVHVKFGTTTAAFTTRSSTQLVATAPAHASGTVKVSVTTPGGTTPTTSADAYKYTVPVPAVVAVSPASGPASGNTAVTVSGSALGGASKVYFGTTAVTATIVVNAAGNQLSVKSPAGTSGTSVNVLVVTPGGESAAVPADLFTYGPTITSLGRTSGRAAGGNKVTITGTGFSTVHSVKFGTTTARTFTVRSATQIIATSPAHLAGQVRISVASAGGTTPASRNDLCTFHSSSVSPPTCGRTAGGRGAGAVGGKIETTILSFGTGRIEAIPWVPTPIGERRGRVLAEPWPERGLASGPRCRRTRELLSFASRGAGDVYPRGESTFPHGQLAI